MQAPLADIAIPCCFHLAYEDDFLSLDVDGYSQKVPCVGTSVKDRRSRCVTKTKSRRHIDAVCLNHSFFPLPVAVRTTRILVVVDVEYRYMGAVEHAFATIIHVAQLDAGSARSRRRCRSDRQELPKNLVALRYGHPNLPRVAPVCGCLLDVRNAAERVKRQCTSWSKSFKTHDRLLNQINPNNFMPCAGNQGK